MTVVNPDVVDVMYRASRPGHGPLTPEEHAVVRLATPADRKALVDLLVIDRQLRPAGLQFKRDCLAELRTEALLLAHRLVTSLTHMDADDPRRPDIKAALTVLLDALRYEAPG